MLLNHSSANTWFERISIMVILLNCVTLGMYQPCENIDCTSDRCQILQVRHASYSGVCGYNYGMDMYTSFIVAVGTKPL